MCIRAVFAIFATAILLMLPAFASDGIRGDSSILNETWSAGFSAQLFDGILYPRWLPELSLGAGSPVFYFYAPIPFYLLAPFHLVADTWLAVTLGSTLLLALSGLAFCFLALSCVRPAAAVAAALIYMALPYHLLADVWARAAIGEQAGFIFVPLALLCAIRLNDGRRFAFYLAAAHGALLLSHLPTALLFAPFLSVACILTAFRGDPFIVLVRSAVAALLSSGLAAAYVLPAMTLQHMIQPDYWSVYTPSESFIIGRPEHRLSTLLETAALFGLALCIVASTICAMGGRIRAAIPWLAAVAAALFLMTPASAWIWSLAPIFDRIQFSWRALLIFEVAAAMTVALALDSSNWKLNFGGLIVSMVIASIVIVSGCGLPKIEQLNKNAVRAFVEAGTDAIEYLPSCRDMSDQEENPLVGIGFVEQSLANRPENSLPVLYYPFLEARVNGQSVAANCDPKTGLIIGEFPSDGRVEIVKRAMPIEIAANLISSFSLLILVAGFMSTRRRA